MNNCGPSPKTGKQRMDSTLLASNIRQMGRVQLLVTVLQRVWRIVDESGHSDGVRTLVAVLGDRGRALPLAWVRWPAQHRIRRPLGPIARPCWRRRRPSCRRDRP